MAKKTKTKSIEKIAVIYKRSVYQKYILDEPNASVRKFLKSKNKTIRPLKKTHDEHYKVIDEIETFINKLGIPYVIDSRHQIPNLKKYDLIITVGGDGTFLRSAQHVQNQPMFGINSLPKVSVGALCSATNKNYQKKLTDIINGKFKTQELPRMSIKINDRDIGIKSVNDVLFTNHCPAATSRYNIQCRGIKEQHKSSGVWIATSTGSTAAIHAAGGVKVPREDRRLQFVTREPYQGIFNPYRLLRGFFNPNQKLKITNKMFHAQVYVDGPTTVYNLKLGDEVSFQTAKESLKIIV